MYTSLAKTGCLMTFSSTRSFSIFPKHLTHRKVIFFCVRVHVCVCACVYVCTSACVCACVLAHVSAYACVRSRCVWIHVRSRVRTCVCVCVCMRAWGVGGDWAHIWSRTDKMDFKFDFSIRNESLRGRVRKQARVSTRKIANMCVLVHVGRARSIHFSVICAFVCLFLSMYAGLFWYVDRSHFAHKRVSFHIFKYYLCLFVFVFLFFWVLFVSACLCMCVLCASACLCVCALCVYLTVGVNVCACIRYQQ